MSLDAKVMLNAIKHEIDKRGKAQRLLPNNVALSLRSLFLKHGYDKVDDNTIANNQTEVVFSHNNPNYTKVVFSALV